MRKYEEGDTVKRIAGGPLMTVEVIDSQPIPIGESQFVSTVWFDAEGKIHRDTFSAISLQKWRLVED